MKHHMLNGVCATALLVSAAGLGGAAWATELSGVISGADGAVRLEGVRVRIEELDRTALTNRDGVYRFTDLPAGDYTLNLSYLGAEDQTITVTIGDADMARDIVMDAGLPQAEQIVVYGQAGSLFDALNQKRASTSLIDVLSADAIGQFPDENVSEAVRRVAGVLVENDQGEGRFVTIRGLNPELNATSINGVRVPAPESDIRGVALDVIDSEVLEGIIINKSLTPDMDGDAIGGSIDIRTTTAFDRGEGLNLTGELGGSYNELTEEFTPKIAASYSDLFLNDTLGVAITASYREREFATENQEVDGPWQVEDGVFWNEELELRDYIVTRERTNVSANLDYRPNDDHQFYLRTLYSLFSDQEFRRRVEVKLDSADIIGVDGNTVLFQGVRLDPDGDVITEDACDALGDDCEEAGIEVDRDSKDRLEEQRIWSVQLGGESRFDSWTADYSLAFSHAEEEEPGPGNLDVVTFRREELDGATIGFNGADLLNPQIVVPAADAFPYAEPGAYEIDEWELIRGLAEDDELALAVNLRRDFLIGGAEAFLKGGAKLRQREKSYDATVEIYEEGDVTLGDFVGANADFPLAQFGPFPDAGAISRFFFANRGGAIELNADDTFVASTVEDYTAEEDIFAVYAMGGYERGPLNIVGGVRVESTELSANATQVRDENPVAVSIEDDYKDVLPSITLRYELTDDIVLRGAAYRALARPTFAGIAPRAEIEGIEGAAAEEGEGGNRNLERQVADNFDLGVEWYIGGNGILSAGVFYKEIDDYIAEIQFIDSEFFGLTFEEFNSFTNLDDASITGIELSYSQALTMLPAPFDGLILGANATFLDGEARFGGAGTASAARTIDLPKLSDTLANVVLGYDKGRFDVRLSYAYRSEYLDEINGGFDDGLDRFVDEHGQWDLTGRFRVTDNVRLYGELKNLNDEPFLAYTHVEGRRVLLQYEEYGFTANVGLKVSY